MKKIFMIITILMFCINFTGCTEIKNGSENDDSSLKADYPIEIGQLVFENAPKTVASLSPALTEIICEMGYENLLTGRSSYCDYPESVKAKTDIGSSAHPNVDKIIKLAPELLVSQSPIAKKDITKIENSGIRVLILSIPDSFAELKQCYVDIAGLLGGAINAQETAEKMLLPLTSALSDIKSNGSFAYIMTYDLAVATGDTLAGDILSYYGENIAKDNQKYIITSEELLTKQPDTIFLALPMNIANLPAETAELNAIKNNKIFFVDNTSFEKPTARLLAQMITSINSEMVITATSETTNNFEEIQQETPVS